MDKILELKNLSFSYGEFSLKDVNLSIEKGYITGLVGRNGAGKTTLFKLVGNKLKNYKGNIYLNGKDIKENRYYLMDNVAFISEEQPFFAEESAIFNAETLGQYYTNMNMEKFEEYMYRFDMSTHTQIKEMSKGTFIKFQLAFALARKPLLYLMDEPTAGLDPVFRKEFLNIIQTAIEDAEASVLFSTHITTDLDKVADFITMIDDGKILYTKDIEQLRNEFDNKGFTIRDLFKREEF